MERTLRYETYLDKVWGCFIGKTVLGTLGAPYEGVKMPMKLPFRQEMIHTMLPNDDLDLQVLWLDVAQKYGRDFTPAMLQRAFAENCDYSPGEYAIMRKNYYKGIYPPYSGSFCNDYYREGMGCPIRSEIWACLSPGDPFGAAEFASRDGILDHEGESVYAERFFAAMEAEAFFESDLSVLIDKGLSCIPEQCRFRELVHNVLALCRKYGDIQKVHAEILFTYGHPDCTNLFQNMGITLASLLLGDLDMIKTGMMALNCGFDTDCTCASAGALLGILHGAKALNKQYGLPDIRYVLGVRSARRSDSVRDLAEDIALLGVRFAEENPEAASIPDAPKREFAFSPKPPLEIFADYVGQDPTIGLGKDCLVTVRIRNNCPGPFLVKALRFVCPESIRVTRTPFGEEGEDIRIAAGHKQKVCLCRFSLDPGAEIVREKNIIHMTVEGENEDGPLSVNYAFGLSGSKLWKLTGPIWKTCPATDEKVLGDKPGYWHTFSPKPTEAEMIDQVRGFHLNFAVDTETDFFTEEELFAPLPEGSRSRIAGGGQTLFARPYTEHFVQTYTDGFTLQELMGFSGPCTVYLSQILISPEDRTVCVQLGHSAPFRLFINGRLIGERASCDQWTSENAHFEKVFLKKGENRIVLRLTKVNADAKFSLIFSDGLTCASHYYDFASKRP